MPVPLALAGAVRDRRLYCRKMLKALAVGLASVGAAATELPRIMLRLNGEGSGRVAVRPDSFDELLKMATAKLAMEPPATRLFLETGDELDEDTVDVIRDDDIVYASSGGAFVSTRHGRSLQIGGSGAPSSAPLAPPDSSDTSGTCQSERPVSTSTLASPTRCTSHHAIRVNPFRLQQLAASNFSRKR